MNNIITVSGLPGSGTTTLAEALSTELDAEYINGGTIFRALAAEKGMELNEFSKYVNNNPEIDKEIDYNLRNVIEQFNSESLDSQFTAENHPEPSLSIDISDEIDFDADTLIIESRLAGWIAGRDATIRIWCHAPKSVRCDRLNIEIASVENTPSTRNPIDAALEREQDEIMRYNEWYGIDLLDTSIYDLSVNTSRWGSCSIADFVTTAIAAYTPRDDEGSTATDAPFFNHNESLQQHSD